MLDAAETQARLARLAPAETSELPETDDLDWVLFHSFPDCEVAPADFAASLPHFERALRAGVSFDYELLFVRTLEVGSAIAPTPREDLARAAIDRTLAGAFEPAEAMAAIRFVARVLPESDAFFARLFAEESLAELRWQISADFALDERELDDYLAVSYLRDADPDAGPRLESFPVGAEAKAQLERFLAADAVRVRLADGFARFADPAERDMLRDAFRERLGLQLDG